jgi:hypothetical protein
VLGGNQNATLQWGGNLMCENVEMSSNFGHKGFRFGGCCILVVNDMIFIRMVPALLLAVFFNIFSARN